MEANGHLSTLIDDDKISLREKNGFNYMQKQLKKELGCT